LDYIFLLFWRINPIILEFLQWNQYYIKHLILNQSHERFIDKLNPEKVFSCNAIKNGYVSDSDLWTLLKSFIKNKNGNISQYSQVVMPQLFKREFLKPLWKTIYEFRRFIKTNIKHDDMISEVVSKLGDPNNSKYRVSVVKALINKCNLKLGELFIIPRSNKFYSMGNEDNLFTVFIDGSEKNISKLLPQKDYKCLRRSKMTNY
jgi:hypothetical protein